MKKEKLLILAISFLFLNACAQNPSSSLQTSEYVESSSEYVESKPTSSSVTSYTSSSFESSSSTESISSSSQEEAMTIVEIDELAKVTSSVKRLTWTDTRDSTSGTAMFSEKEIVEQGKKDGEDFIKYRGYDDTYYYEVSTGINSISKKYKISSSSSSNEKTQDEVVKLVDSFEHNHEWFYNKAKETYTNPSIVEEKTTVNQENTKNGLKFTISSITNSTRTYETIYEFNENNQLISGRFKSYNWDKLNIDSENHEVIDPSQNPNEKIEVSISLTLGEKTSNEDGLKFDLSPYFITSLNDIYVSTFTDEENNMNVCEVGNYIDLYLENNYSPATALNKNSFMILSSSNENVIAKTSETSTYYKAISEGTSTLLIGDYFQEVTKEIIVNVRKPALTSLYIESPKSSMYVNDETTLSLSSLPSGADKFCEIVIDDSSIVTIENSSKEDEYIVKGLKAGVANVYFKSTINPEIRSNTLTFTIKEKPVVDITSLYGTWTWTDNSDFTCTLNLNQDGTGTLSQKVMFIAYPNSAEFSWEYDGSNLIFSNWYSEGQTIRKPSKVSINEDFTIISITAASMDADEIMQTLNMQFTKSK